MKIETVDLVVSIEDLKCALANVERALSYGGSRVPKASQRVVISFPLDYRNGVMMIHTHEARCSALPGADSVLNSPFSTPYHVWKKD